MSCERHYGVDLNVADNWANISLDFFFSTNFTLSSAAHFISLQQLSSLLRSYMTNVYERLKNSPSPRLACFRTTLVSLWASRICCFSMLYHITSREFCLCVSSYDDMKKKKEKREHKVELDDCLRKWRFFFLQLFTLAFISLLFLSFHFIGHEARVFGDCQSVWKKCGRICLMCASSLEMVKIISVKQNWW